MRAHLLLVLPAVLGHAYVERIAVGGQSIETYQPFNDPYKNPKPQRITRPFANNSPVSLPSPNNVWLTPSQVEDVSSNTLTCNFQSDKSPSAAVPAPIHATVAAGATLDFHWTKLDPSHKGPVLTVGMFRDDGRDTQLEQYLAKCPGDCEDYVLKGGEKIWVKIDEGGYDGNDKVSSLL
jgi:hypothetical protein